MHILYIFFCDDVRWHHPCLLHPCFAAAWMCPTWLSGTKTLYGWKYQGKKIAVKRLGAGLCRGNPEGRWGYPEQTQSSFTNIEEMLSEELTGEGVSLWGQFKRPAGWWHCFWGTEAEQEVVGGGESKPDASTGSPFLSSQVHCFNPLFFLFLGRLIYKENRSMNCCFFNSSRKSPETQNKRTKW